MPAPIGSGPIGPGARIQGADGHSAGTPCCQSSWVLVPSKLLLRHPVSMGDVIEVIDEHVQVAPAPALRGIVSHYSGYRQRGVAPAIHRGLPSPYLTLIFTIDEPLHVVQHVDPRSAPGSYSALLGGLHSAPAYISHDGAQSGVQVHLDPLGARRLLGVPSGELSDVDVAADLLLEGVVEQVRSRLIGAVDWPSRFAAVDDVLQRQLRPAPATDDEVRFAWSRLLATSGKITVKELAAETGWSERHLGNRMRQQAGLTSKRAARVIRFYRAHRTVQRVGTDLARVAAECGYADQSHMTREFVEMAGCPPHRWFVEEFGKIQAPVGIASPSLVP